MTIQDIEKKLDANVQPEIMREDVFEHHKFIKSFYRKEIEELVKELIPRLYVGPNGEDDWSDGYDHCLLDIKANAKSLGINLD